MAMTTAFLLAAGCADNSYRGKESVFADYETPMAIKVAVGDPYVKGTGPVDSLLSFQDKQIFVWAYLRDTVDVDYRITAEEDNLVCLLDSARAAMDGINSIAEWVYFDKGVLTDTTYFYPSGEDCNKTYDFYALYADDAKLLGEQRSKDELVRSYQIDGSQDFMYSKAVIPLDNKTGLPNQNAFSYLSVLRGDDPVFRMSHAFTRIDLYVRAGVTVSQHTVKIQSAELDSRTHVDVTAVAKEGTRMGAKFLEGDSFSFLPLTNANGTLLDTLRLTTVVPDYTQPVEERLSMQQMQDTVKFHRLGGSFFVSPEKSYHLNVDARTVDLPGGDVPTITSNDIKLKDASATFQQGNRYAVFMTLYGLLDVAIHVEMVPWSFNGSFYMDKDMETEVQILTDADGKMDENGFLNLMQGEEFLLRERNYQGSQMTVSSSAPDVVSVEEGEAGTILKAQVMPEGVTEAKARITITAQPTVQRPEGGFRQIKVKVK